MTVLSHAAIVLACHAPTTALPTIEQVIAGLQSNEARMRSFHVSARYNVEQSVTAARVRVSLFDDVQFTMDRHGRFRLLCEGTRLLRQNPPKTGPRKRLAVFDGTTSVVLAGVDRYTEALVTASREDALTRGDPRDLTTHYQGRPVSVCLTRLPASRVVGEDVWQDRRVLVVESGVLESAGPVEKDDRVAKFVFYIDVERGWAVVRKAATFRFRGQENWQEYSPVSAYDLAENDGGVWLPQRIVLQSDTFPSRPGIPVEMLYRYEVLVDRWEVDPPVDDSEFTIELPPGVLVNDKIQGRTYSTVAISDALLQRQVNEARRLATAGMHPVVKLGMLIGISMAVLCIAWLLARRRRPTGRPDR